MAFHTAKTVALIQPAGGKLAFMRPKPHPVKAGPACKDKASVHHHLGKSRAPRPGFQHEKAQFSDIGRFFDTKDAAQPLPPVPGGVFGHPTCLPRWGPGFGILHEGIKDLAHQNRESFVKPFLGSVDPGVKGNQPISVGLGERAQSRCHGGMQAWRHAAAKPRLARRRKGRYPKGRRKGKDAGP